MCIILQGHTTLVKVQVFGTPHHGLRICRRLVNTPATLHRIQEMNTGLHRILLTTTVRIVLVIVQLLQLAIIHRGQLTIIQII